MKRIFQLTTLLLLAACGGEAEQTPDSAPAAAPAAAPGSNVGATGTDATAVPLAGDSTATDAAHP